MGSSRLLRAVTVTALGLLGLSAARVAAGIVDPTTTIALPPLQGPGNELGVSVDTAGGRLFVAAGSDTSAATSVNILSMSGHLISSLDWDTLTGHPSFPERLQYLPGSGQLLVLSQDEMGPAQFNARLYELSLTSGGAHVDKVLNVQSLSGNGDGLTQTSTGVWLSNGTTLSRVSLNDGSLLQTIHIKGAGNLQGFGDIASTSNGFLFSANSGVTPSILLRINQNGNITGEAQIHQALGLDSNPATNTIYALRNGAVDVYQGVTFSSSAVPLPAAFWPGLGTLGMIVVATARRRSRRVH